MDRLVRLWNPYVTSKPTGRLRGHSAPICYLCIVGTEKRLYSVSTDRCIKVCSSLALLSLVCLRNIMLLTAVSVRSIHSHSRLLAELNVYTNNYTLFRNSQSVTVTVTVTVTDDTDTYSSVRSGTATVTILLRRSIGAYSSGSAESCSVALMSRSVRFRSCVW